MAQRIILDVSSYQAGIDFAAVKARNPEIVGVIIKATEGPWPGTNPDFDRQYASAKNAGLTVGFYHFDHMSVDPVAQANMYLQRVAGKTAELGHWLDFEGNDIGASNAAVEAHILAWLNRVKAVYPGKAGVYTGAYFPWSQAINLTGHPLWLAAYTANPPWTPDTLGRPLLFWQFTDRYSTAHGAIDGSVFLGTDDHWNAMTGQAPAPAPTPDAKDDPVATNLAHMPVINPGRDVGHPHTVAIIEALLRVANPTVDLSSKGKLTAAIVQWQAVLFNDWLVVGGKNDQLVTGVCDMNTLTSIMLATAMQDKK